MNPIASFFAWLRRRSAQAVLDGIADAAEQLETGDSPSAEIPAALRERLSLPVPANGNGRTRAAAR